MMVNPDPHTSHPFWSQSRSHVQPPRTNNQQSSTESVIITSGSVSHRTFCIWSPQSQHTAAAGRGLQRRRGQLLTQGRKDSHTKQAGLLLALIPALAHGS
mmetsp:Transcript_17627/g.44395  ORF Transcript_17627/g.44395 Transcript_17627/m.44395 type:complete len:100 (+) Transcript_17627:337-636(+)